MLDSFAWDQQQSRYVHYEDPESASIADLKNGRTGGFRNLVEFSYYGLDNWREVLTLFPEFRDQLPDSESDFQSPQDDLLEALDQYQWDADRGVYQRVP